MATSFSSLPIIDLQVLSSSDPSSFDLHSLSRELHHVFKTVGFAYLVNAPLSFSHDEVFRLARDFFRMDHNIKMDLAKRSFVEKNTNTYRGYFPTQPGQQDNLKEGFEVGRSYSSTRSIAGLNQKFNLSEPSVWPSTQSLPNGRERMELLHGELQALSSTLLSLLAMSLGKPSDFFSSYLVDSLSTLRLLHYPPQASQSSTSPSPGCNEDDAQLCCTPHTDSGILTLLHQDPTGGLEVQNSQGEWVAAPYLPGSVVVNIGDLLASVSGGRFVATMHRVRTCNAEGRADGMGRFSVPFFFEPGENCIVRGIDNEDGDGDCVVYGEHVRKKMGTWIEFQDWPIANMESETGTMSSLLGAAEVLVAA